MSRSVPLSLVLTLWALALLSASCRQPPPIPETPIDLEAERAALIEMERRFEEACESKDLDDFMEFWSDDAWYFPMSAPRVQGKEGIREGWRRLLENPDVSLTWKPTLAEVASSGDLGYTFGPVFVARVGEEPGEPVGKYLTIWRKNDAGEWKVVADIGNDDRPAPPPPPE